jgi:dolichol-phosphate mannosyltransferase
VWFRTKPLAIERRMATTRRVLSVIIPLYNEEDNVAPLQDEIAGALRSREYELILVDDGSSDRTLERIQRGPGVRVIEFEKNTGQSAAMYVGIMAARGDILVTMDGDRQNDPADILRMLAKLDEGFDFVCGWRRQRQDNLSKKISSKIANFVRSRFTRDGVHDTGCSLKVMRRECREALFLFRGMHRFIPALIKGLGCRITELPVNHRPRTAGVSKYGFGSRAWKATCDMLAVRWFLSRQLKVRIRRES